MNPYTLQKEGQRNLVIDKHNNTFAVSNVLYEILYDHQQGLHADNISKALVSKYKNEGFTANFVEDALKLALDRFASANYAYDGLDGFLVGKITLVPEGSLTIIYRTLSRLFNRYILVVLLPLAILLTANVFYTYELYSAAQIFEVSVSISDSLTLVLSYLFFLVFIFFHELGHASATTYFGLSPKKIGFGFYFIFPVFYTDVTPIWRLNVRKRNVVNIGGIYFQLLINIILVILLEYDIAFPL